ncbi:UDP-glycosyltransferase 83A1-like [Vigna unguiculata]|uniref:UDP-glycosyltransferase 83A1-like n=1 Tax=Vigna unguiculata TaxID=3917 RepID=UPI001015F51D|nr:UDP-glycosyltransferase 83A1-like [Vigna unguiculata]
MAMNYKVGVEEQKPKHKMMSISSVLVFPSPFQGHVNPMAALSEKLVENGFKVIFVNTEFNHKRVVGSMVDQYDEESPLKLVSIPDGLEPNDDRSNVGKLCDSMLSTMPQALKKLIQDNDNNNNNDSRIRFIVVDLHVGWALNVACESGIKGALFWPASATAFHLLYSVPRLLHDGIIDPDGSILTSKKTIQLSPSMPEMEPRTFFWLHMAGIIDSSHYLNYLVHHCTPALNLTEWWFCDTAHELEPEVLTLLPKLIPIGPLLRIDHRSKTNNAPPRSLGQFWEEDLSCMSWLDEQAHGSVVYVAFGSFTLFDSNQFNELALGLDLSNRPFLWVIREDNKMEYPTEFKGHKGKIVSWAPQQKVLSHPAIACFVTHCGWNSTMEGLSNGVPLLCWPYYGDQLYNERHICDELKVGLGFDKDHNGLVSRKELKTKVEQIFNDEKIKSRSVALKGKVMKNVAKGGTSYENLEKFVKEIKQ